MHQFRIFIYFQQECFLVFFLMKVRLKIKNKELDQSSVNIILHNEKIIWGESFNIRIAKFTLYELHLLFNQSTECTVLRFLYLNGRSAFLTMTSTYKSFSQGHEKTQLLIYRIIHL